MPKEDYVLKIIAAMQKADKPLILNHIAKRAEISPQLADYHLAQMIRKGLVLLVEELERKYYMLQPIFYDENWLDALYSMLIPFVEGMKDKIGYEQYDVNMPKEWVVVNILVMFLRRFEEELEGVDFSETSKSF